jgi:hypothetical protein
MTLLEMFRKCLTKIINDYYFGVIHKRKNVGIGAV